MSTLKRSLAGAPAAIIITTGLGLLMAGMIKVEYEALAEKPEKLSFVINEMPEETEPDFQINAPVLQVVEVPPPPPVIESANESLPPIDLTTLDPEPPALLEPTVEWDNFTIAVDDKEAQPIMRIPPVMPVRFSEGNHSGRCAVRFNVSAEGSPFNVQITSCSAKILEGATKKAVLKWRYQPKIVDGQAVMMSGVQDVIVYNLLDQNGRRLPEL